MQYAEDLEGVVFDSVRQNEGGAAYDQLARAGHPACAAGVGMFSQELSRLPDPSYHFSGGVGIVF